MKGDLFVNAQWYRDLAAAYGQLEAEHEALKTDFHEVLMAAQAVVDGAEWFTADGGMEGWYVREGIMNDLKHAVYGAAPALSVPIEEEEEQTP